MKYDFAENIPDYVINVARDLKNVGFGCYLVGGPVRDILMGITPDDYDLATDARPEQIVETFPKSVTTNAKFGTVIVLSEDSVGELHSVEVTTFRSEADYVDGRWPTKVEFTTDLQRDLGRRDFTVNSVAIDLQKLDDGIEENDLIDLFGGLEDIRNQVIRAVGTPKERFLEDGLRSYRACRMASSLGFKIDKETFHAICETLDVARQISKERVRDEFVKLIMRSPKPSVGIELLREAGLLGIFLPEILEGVGVLQAEVYHSHDVYTHSLRTLDAAEDSVKIAALLHDIGKPRCADDGGHFYRHDVVSADMAREILTRLKFSKKEIDRNYRLVRWHMFMFSNWRDGEYDSNWSDSAIRRFIKNVGGEEYVDDLFKLRLADALSNPKTSFDPGEIQALEKRISEVRAKDMALHVSDLNIDGNDLAELGVEKGVEMGRILNELLDRVIDDPMLNTREKLLNLVKEIR